MLSHPANTVQHDAANSSSFVSACLSSYLALDQIMAVEKGSHAEPRTKAAHAAL